MDLSRFHPEVIEEYERRAEGDPSTCHHPLGACHRTAQRPNPQWCAKRLGHEGSHMPEHKRRADLERRAQNQAAYIKRKKANDA